MIFVPFFILFGLIGFGVGILFQAHSSNSKQPIKLQEPVKQIKESCADEYCKSSPDIRCIGKNCTYHCNICCRSVCLNIWKEQQGASIISSNILQNYKLEKTK